ncbi:MAG: hypothetical protein Q4F43_05460 [Eubacteriales bacterium]|nr:hypothetical protein [Eubacteriales bacterium]
MDKHKEMKGKWGALRTWLLTATAVMLVMSAMMGTAWAYFTTYATARGGHIIKLGHEEKITESFANWNKRVDITIEKYSEPVYVRARGFSKYPLSYSDVEQNPGATPTNSNWVRGTGENEGWMIYTKPLMPGTDSNGAASIPAKADPLYVRINNVPQTELDGVKEGDTFNVIIVYEATAVEYDENGDPVGATNANWDEPVYTSRLGG